MLRHGPLARFALVTAFAIAGTGCYLDFDTEWETVDDFDYYGGEEFDVLGASIEGELGEVRPEDGVWRQRGTELPGFTMVEVQSSGREASGRGWAAMTQLELQGSFDDPAFEPGAVLVFEDGADGPSGLEATVLGCSGQSRGVWDYDRNAQKVTLEVSESIRQGWLHIEMTSEFDHDGSVQTCTTGFDVAR